MFGTATHTDCPSPSRLHRPPFPQWPVRPRTPKLTLSYGPALEAGVAQSPVPVVSPEGQARRRSQSRVFSGTLHAFSFLTLRCIY